jgi:hypothetical protein
MLLVGAQREVAVRTPGDAGPGRRYLPDPAVLDGQQPLPGNLDSVESLRTWGDAIVSMQRERHCQGGCPIGSLASDLADIWPEARADLAGGFAEWEAAIRAGLRAMHGRGDLRQDADPGQLALATLAALQGGLLLTQTRRDTVALEAALGAMFDHIASLVPDASSRRPSQLRSPEP